MSVLQSFYCVVLCCVMLCYVLMCCVCLADLVSYFTALLVYVL